ncbi:Protein FAR1-RELATED SEQUENCE 5, partial [Frankliniella fusca]
MKCQRDGLVVSKLIETHNHERTKARFDAMSRNRGMPKETAEKPKLLMEGGVKPSVVRNILRDLGAGRVTQRDLANARAKWKREASGGATEEECFMKSLQEILDADKHAYIDVTKEDNGTLKYVFIQTSAMRKNVELYGRVILLDHSYKINKNRMPVCCMMVMDGAGSGRSAGYAFVINKRATTVKEVVKCFREAITEPLAKKVKTFVIDKDPSEIAAIQAVFPDAQVQLCLFLTGKTLKEKSAKENAETRDAVDHIKYATTESEYNSLKSDII